MNEVNTPSDPRAELARVVELQKTVPPEQFMAECMNFVVKHGASLLSSHGVGGEAVASEIDRALEIGWRAGVTCSANVCVQRSDDWNRDDAHPHLIDEASDCSKAIARWLDPAGHTLDELRVMFRFGHVPTHTAPPPQPRAEGMVLDATEREAIETLLNLAYAAWGLADNTEDSGGEGLTVERSDFALLEKHLDTLDEMPDDQPGYAMGAAAKARWSLRRLISAAPSEGSAASRVEGDCLRIAAKEWVRIVQEEPTGEDPYACGYQAALCEVAKVLGTPPPASQGADKSRSVIRREHLQQGLPAPRFDVDASQSATPSDELPELPEPEIDGTRYDPELKVCYTGKVGYTADQMRAYGQLCRNGGRP